jgi:Uma2 family endonuclease
MNPEAVLAPQDAQPDYSKMITEDDTPVDSIYSCKQQRLLAEVLYTSWRGHGEGRPFFASTSVGLFYSTELPAVVPDLMLSLDVTPPADPMPKANRSYFMWKYGKPPELVVEVVSNRDGEEDSKKLRLYANIGITYYVIWDVEDQLRGGRLRAFTLRDRAYVPLQELWLPAIGLGLAVWHGVYEDFDTDWLRFVDRQGQLFLTGDEQRQRAEHLAARLREHGIEET